jgi:hypothetical protein
VWIVGKEGAAVEGNPRALLVPHLEFRAVRALELEVVDPGPPEIVHDRREPVARTDLQDGGPHCRPRRVRDRGAAAEVVVAAESAVDGVQRWPTLAAAVSAGFRPMPVR